MFVAWRKWTCVLQSVVLASVMVMPNPSFGSIGSTADAAPKVVAWEKYLIDGRLREGDSALSAQLKHHSHDDNLRFELGILQFIRAVEVLGQDLYRYGLRSTTRSGAGFIPILRMPVPDNPNPELLTYEKGRGIVARFVENLTKAEETMAPISDPNVRVPLHFGLVKLDLTGDGKADDDDALWQIYSRLGRRDIKPESAKDFYIKFDRGDVHWLRGYCHLLSGVCEVFLAYDTHESFNCNAHLFFPKVDSPYPFLQQPEHDPQSGRRFEVSNIVDLIAMVHLIRWPLAERQRMESALHHFEAVVAQSKESWKWIMAETDNDHEWLPNPRQTSVIPGARVTDDMVASWQKMMDQIGLILAGEVLIPFWRRTPEEVAADPNGPSKCGVNLRRAFLEPTNLDLVEWIQGPAAAPYLEQKPTVATSSWRDLQRSFGTQFPGYALWFN